MYYDERDGWTLDSPFWDWCSDKISKIGDSIVNILDSFTESFYYPEDHREVVVSLCIHTWINIPEYKRKDGKYIFTGKYKQLQYSKHDLYGRRSDYTIENSPYPVLFHFPIRSIPQKDYDLLKKWQMNAQEQPNEAWDHYTLLQNNCISHSLAEALNN